MRSVKAFSKITLYVLGIVVVAPLQTIVLSITKGPAAYVLPKLFHQYCCLILSIQCEVRGTPNKKNQTLYMCNHVSYLDIPLLGSIINGSFLAKKEVSEWPLFGFLAKIQQTAFIERKTREIGREKSKLEKFISDGKSLIVFPEGTSSSGLTVKPFKSSLFSLTEGLQTPIDIQPVTISIIETDGKRANTKEEHDIYAWPLEMETPLHVHLWLFAKTRGARLVVTFHDPLKVPPGTDRKTLANTCFDRVCKGLEAARAA